MAATTTDQPLAVSRSQSIDAAELDLQAPQTLDAQTASPGIQSQVDVVIDRLYSLDLSDLRKAQTEAQKVQNLGKSVQEDLLRSSAMLKQPLRKLMDDAEDGGPVAKNLLELQRQVNEINPNDFNFNMSGFRRLLSMLPGVGTPVANWMARYQSVEGTIGDIVDSLKNGRAQLERDNITLREDQLAMRDLTKNLQEFVRFGQLLDQRLDSRITSDTSLTEDRQRFLQEEVLFPLRQRIMDLQQQLAVNQQGVITAETVVRNNQELIRGVSRSLNVTIPALSTAATFAMAAQTQKQVLKGINAVNETTDRLISQTAEKLRTQGVEIQRQAASSQLDVEGLKKAFTDVQAALDDISKFRREALPEMARSIVEMDELTDKMESSIKKMEDGSQSQAELDIIITDA